MQPLDFLGLKNFRVFNDEDGFCQALSSINILTGANNSGKSSIIKSLQMLKNSIKEKQFPFDLDLTNQEHLLGDFENLLFNKERKQVEVSLPFAFLGIQKLYIKLEFAVPSSKGSYNAYLRGLEVIDQTDTSVIFSFKYREADNEETESDRLEFTQERERYEKEKSERAKNADSIFSNYGFHFPPTENPLIGFIEWTLNLGKLKSYVLDLREFYEAYLTKRNTWKPLEEIDKILDKSGLIPTLLIKSFKGDVSIESWNAFIEKLGDRDSVSGREKVGDRDLEPEDYFFPIPQIEDVLYYQVLKILKNKLPWTSDDNDGTSYAVIENSFRASWQILVNRMATINYVSTTREENLRIYNVGTNSPFIKLLHDYRNNGHANTFVRKYLKAFEIGSKLEVDYQPKYQLMSVSITTTDGDTRELVDFGYGIKQLIVFLIQISVLAEKNKRSEHGYDNEGNEYMEDVYEPSLLLIEEPESNLHPKWQSLMAEMFMQANKDFNIQLIIETHSEYLIRRFQTLVAEKKLSGDSVKIFYLRSPQRSAAKQQFESVTIQDDGSINYRAFDSGFFDESEKLELSLLNVQRDNFLRDFENLKEVHQESEEKIVGLQKKIDDFTNQLDAIVYANSLNSRFDTTKLTLLTVNYLSSGQYLLHNIHTTADYSPTVIQYGRAVEYELKHKLFIHVNAGATWMLGNMQGSLEKLLNGVTACPHCNAGELATLGLELSNKFSHPNNLRIDLLEVIRTTRNSAGHAGQTMTKLEAENYIQTVNQFLDAWIAESV